MAGTRLAALVVSVALWTISGTALAAGPSFDCVKAGTWAEKTICKSEDLAALDAWFTPLYGQVAQRLAGKDLDDLKARRKAWLTQRNDCKAEADGTACLKKSYQLFTGELERQFADLVENSVATQFVKDFQCVLGGPACLEGLVEAEQAKLADAEAKAGDAAAQRDQVDENAHAVDRLGEANVAWRGYRNAECKRRQEGAGSEAEGVAVFSACLIDLTRQRIQQLPM
jgi:uncharacterized protein